MPPMESLLPGLFFLAHLAPVILRVALAALFIYDAKQIWDSRRRRIFAGGLGLVGVLIGIGLFTQAAVIAGGVMAVVAHAQLKERSLFANLPTLILTLATLAFLLVTGAGGLAFDLPY
jgi:hypothetical protein